MYGHLEVERVQVKSMTLAAKLPVAPGLSVALAVAVAATLLGRLVPIVGGPVLGIVLGAAFAGAAPAVRGPAWTPGYAFASKPVLQTSIVVLGTGLSLPEVVRVGGHSLPVMLGTLAVALGGAWLLGRILGVHGNVRTLIGVGTGICGASAIAATTAVIGAAESEIAYAVGTIFTFNIAAVLLFPPIGHLLGMSPHEFGLWSGTAINDTSSVVAAAYAFGGGAGPYSIVVKLTRTLMLIPIVLFLAARSGRCATGDRVRLPWRRIVPVFLLGFLAAAALDSIGVIPSSWHPTLSDAGTFLITTALAGIGLSLRLGDLRRAGPRPLLLGGLLWLAVALSSLGLQDLTGTL
ncbi:YeiH family protein [Amycolatopsis alkalitolerans]|uniref:Putative sulfate exporter family transporter n=1 Tax=Amycolatopsis alkalitolerans TaxID=2547244 RepID=A0A5C4LUX6_9PSEU|nr:putative sulfate exporter family transporter [Amycolatopsis alkalitolerans]TNC21794.1 putative sulfate exporter family transporter [Amycolatopsis alkalitolerans]